MRRVKTHKFNGVTYDIDLDTNCAGYCESPKPKGNPCLHVGVPINTKDGLIKLCHEMLHAARFSAHENTVERTSEDIGSLLWRLNYRIKK